MNTQIYRERRNKLRTKLQQKGLAALVVTLDANRYYLSGFELHDPQMDESSGRLIICADGNDWLCTDSRFIDAAKRLWDEKYILIYKLPAYDINGLLQARVEGKVGFEARHMNVAFYNTLAKDIHLEPADGLIESLRLIKDASEIALLEDACALNHQLMQWVPSVLVPHRTEKEVAWDIEQFFRNHGAEELSFASIVAFNANAALPHAIPGSATLQENSAVLIDVGCRKNDYCSDQTRSFWVGDTKAPWFTEHLELVQEAQQKAIEIIRPGVFCSHVYAAAKNIFIQHGVDHLFNHGLGHGIGLQTHEGPSLNANNHTPLEAGMVVTVEPGLYQSAIGGIRWEYMVLVTEDGRKIL